ncbi:MAG TPA: AMP-binding protein [Kofleriaceae bacterium]
MNSLVEVLRAHAERRPTQLAFTYLAPDGSVESQLTYAELDRRARGVAAELQREGDVRGERVLIIQPHALDFVTAFFGALYAGAVAMPVVPSRTARMTTMLEALVANGAPSLASVDESFRSKLAGLPGAAHVRIVQGEGAAGADDWREPALDPASLALLQYTSGSTGLPRGVMVTHGNLLHNERMMSHVFRMSAETRLVSWLPLFHDMGLIGNVLHAAYVGSECVLMAPTTFLQSPARWLQAITRHRGFFSGAPDFAYALCADKVSDAELAQLDLSSWKVAYNGAEPVRAATLERFARRFAPAGFDRRAFYPCYGLAEATLFVSGGLHQTAPRTLRVVSAELQRDVIRLAEREDEGQPLVSCGRLWHEQRVVIAEAGSGQPLPDGRVGEVWLSGPSMATGYFRNPDASRVTFGAHLASGEGPFLRTGDLGFLFEGELFIAGRSKDMVIVRGRNHYAQDLEATAEGCDAGLRVGGGACFSVDDEAQETIVLVQEAPRAADHGSLARAIRQAIFAQHEVHVARIAFVPAGVLPRTSSGKVQRSTCRARLAAGELRLLHDDDARTAGGAAVTAGGGAGPLDQARDLVARALRLDASALDGDVPLVALGLDSLSAAELRGQLEALGVSGVDFAELLSTATVASLGALLATLAPAAVAPRPPIAAPLPSGPSGPPGPSGPSGSSGSGRTPSAAQRRFWLLEQL